MQIKLLGLLLLITSHSAFSSAKIEQWQTPNGSAVFYVETKGLPMVDIRVVFDAGSARDGHQQGVAALTSALLDTGAGSMNADDIAQRFENVGAQFGSGVSRDMAWLSLRSLSDKKLLNKALSTLQQIISTPLFNEKDIQREKNRTLAGLKHREESPGALASIALYNALYKDHPYAHPSAGIVETVAELSANNLKDFYRQYYVANNTMVVIVGEVGKQQAIKIANNLVANLAAGTVPPKIAEVDFSQQGLRKHIAFPSTQTHVLAGLIGDHRKDPDYFELYVGNHILGGSGLVSQLFGEVREKRGLAYSAYSYLSPFFRKGPFIMGLQTRNDQTIEAIKVMKNTLSNFVSKGPSEKALVAAKKNLTGGFAMRSDTNRKLTSYVSMIGFYRLPLDYLDQFQRKIEATTVASIQDAFKRRVNPALLHIISVGGK